MFFSGHSFRKCPIGCMVLSCDLEVLNVTEEYARITLSDPARMIGRYIFDLFPDNPGDPEADGVRNLKRSLETVLITRTRSPMAWQRYDIRDSSGKFLERHWSPLNTPLLDANGEVSRIVHHATDITPIVKYFGHVRPTGLSTNAGIRRLQMSAGTASTV